MTPEEEAFASTLTAVIAADVAANPANGTLVRVILRWFEWRSPEYLTLHVLGTEDDDQDEPWAPLEWDNGDDQLQRTNRIVNHPDVVRTAAALQPQYEDRDDIPAEHPPSPAIRAVVARLPSTLAHLKRVPHFAVVASHFEQYGMLVSLQEANPPEVVAMLEARDELPPDE